MLIVSDIRINVRVSVFVNFELLFFSSETWNELLLVLLNNNDFPGK